jgi:hypothetical protein
MRDKKKRCFGYMDPLGVLTLGKGISKEFFNICSNNRWG